MNLRELGFTEEQIADLTIILSLRSHEEIVQWMESVGEEDVEYGLQLMETVVQLANMKKAEYVETEEYSPASELLNKFFK